MLSQALSRTPALASASSTTGYAPTAYAPPTSVLLYATSPSFKTYAHTAWFVTSAHFKVTPSIASDECTLYRSTHEFTLFLYSPLLIAAASWVANPNEFSKVMLAEGERPRIELGIAVSHTACRFVLKPLKVTLMVFPPRSMPAVCNGWEMSPMNYEDGNL